MKVMADSIELVNIGELVPHPKNMHKHPPEQIERLVKLIEYQGMRNPVIVQKGTNLIVAGHGRLMALKKMGASKCPVIYQEFDSEAQLYAYMVSDNAIGKESWSELDLSAVNTEMLDLGPDFDVDLLGIKDFVIEPIEKFDPQADEDEVPEVVHPITRKGDIWLLGNHRLMCGDSTMIDEVEKLMNGEKADMVLTDPPYGINLDTEYQEKPAVKGNKYRKILNDDKDFDASFLVEYFSRCEQFWWGANYYQETLPKGGSWIVWDKSNKEQDNVVSSSFEICYSVKKHRNLFYRKLWKGFTAKEKNEKRLHPTQKPVEMAEWFFTNWGKSCIVIVDLFLGSGSTLIACEKTNRKCYGMELDEKYCDVIINRWQNYTGKKAVLESTKQTYEELKLERGN